MHKAPLLLPAIIFLVYVLIVLIRLLLAWQTYDSPMHTLDGNFVSILTHDASLYGYYAKLLLNGLPHDNHVYAIEYIIYYLVKLTPFSLEQVMYYAPSFLSALIVIPTMLISALYMNSKIIISIIGLVSGIGYGYYSRTYLGYMDTDVLNVVLPMFILYGMVYTIRKDNYYYLLIVFTSNILFLSWYHSSMPIIYSMNVLFLFYYILFYFYKNKIFIKKYKYYFLSALVFVILLLLFIIDFDIFYRHVQNYIFKENFITISGFNFIATMQHLSEAKSSNINFIAHLISGNIYLFGLSLIGYLLLTYKYKEMILALPLVFLGIISVYAGIRFHIYATAILIISLFYLVDYIIISLKQKILINIMIILLFTVSAFYENFKIVQYWNTEGAVPVFYPEQIVALKKLEKIKQADDYAITWWDHGWPLWYYAGLNTMIDNGRHTSDNYTVANILLSDSQKFAHHASHYFYNIFHHIKMSAINKALKEHKNPQQLFNYINNINSFPNNNIDKYIILPIQMAELAYTIYIFANIDPISGSKVSNHTFKMFTKKYEDKDFIYLNDNSKIHKQKSTLLTENKRLTIKKISSIQYKNNIKTIKTNTVSSKGLNLIVQGKKFYIMDNYFYRSNLIQMLFFNNYDKKYFTPVHIGKTMSIYKVNTSHF